MQILFFLSRKTKNSDKGGEHGRHNADRKTQTYIKMKTLPSTLAEVRAAAASRLSDFAVISVNIYTTFGEVTVWRDGTIKMATDFSN